MAEPLSNGNVTNIYNQFPNSTVGNFANQAQDGASQNYGVDGGAIATTQGNGKLVQSDGEGLLRSLLGPTASKLGQELGQMAGIQAWFWKMDLLQACLEKAAEKMQRLGIEPKQVKGKFLKPLLEGAAMEDEPELQELWANLIASTAAERESHPAFAKILSEFAVSDAQFLEDFRRGYGGRFEKYQDTAANLENLVRLGIFEKISQVLEEQQHFASLGAPPLMPSQQYQVQDQYQITALGCQFLKAVQGP